MKKLFELKNEGYRDGIKRGRQDRDGIAYDGIAYLVLLTVECFTLYKLMM